MLRAVVRCQLCTDASAALDGGEPAAAIGPVLAAANFLTIMSMAASPYVQAVGWWRWWCRPKGLAVLSYVLIKLIGVASR